MSLLRKHPLKLPGPRPPLRSSVPIVLQIPLGMPGRFRGLQPPAEGRRGEAGGLIRIFRVVVDDVESTRPWPGTGPAMREVWEGSGKPAPRPGRGSRTPRTEGHGVSASEPELQTARAAGAGHPPAAARTNARTSPDMHPMSVLDANVASEPMRPTPECAVAVWRARRSVEALFLTAVGDAELRYGVVIMPTGRQRALPDVPWTGDPTSALAKGFRPSTTRRREPMLR